MALSVLVLLAALLISTRGEVDEVVKLREMVSELSATIQSKTSQLEAIQASCDYEVRGIASELDRERKDAKAVRELLNTMAEERDRVCSYNVYIYISIYYLNSGFFSFLFMLLY